MKKVTVTGKLSLNKETVTKLNNAQMSKINGGRAVINTEVVIINNLPSYWCGTVTASHCGALPGQCGL